MNAPAPQPRASIHNSGESAVDLLKSILESKGHAAVKGPRSGPNAAKVPDILFTPNGQQPIPLEVKKASSSVPQLRPLAYKVVVVWRAPDDGQTEQWWVIPPQDLLVLALNHPGQHCISSFECMNTGAPNANWNQWICPHNELDVRIVTAFEAGNDSPLRAKAQAMRRNIRRLYKRHKSWVAR